MLTTFQGQSLTTLDTTPFHQDSNLERVVAISREDSKLTDRQQLRPE